MCYFWFPNDLIISSQRKNEAEPITVKQTAQAILSSYMLASANEYTVQRNHNLFTKKKKKSHKNLTSQENCLQWIIQPSVTSSWAPSLFLTWSISFSFFSFLPPPPLKCDHWTPAPVLQTVRCSTHLHPTAHDGQPTGKEGQARSKEQLCKWHALLSSVHTISWVGRNPQGPSSPTPCTTQHHANVITSFSECCPSTPWSPAAQGRAYCPGQPVPCQNDNMEWEAECNCTSSQPD